MTRTTALIVLAVSLTTLAGCLGTEAPAASPASSTGLDQGDTSLTTQNISKGSLPHVHDGWGGADRIPLLDKEYDLKADDAVFWAFAMALFAREPLVGGALVNLPGGALVHEGTGRLEVTVSWSSPTVTGIKFAYRHAGSNAIHGWVPTPNGAVATLEVTPDMTDMPHTQTSRWMFAFSAAGTPAVALGTIHVKMDIVRTRDPAVYPGHPDHWQGAQSIPLLDASGKAPALQAPRALIERAQDPMGDPSDTLTGGRPVPMETGALIVTATITSIEPSPLAVDHLHLFYRTVGGWGFVKAGTPVVSGDRLTWTWRIPVEMEGTDSPYAATSAWAYRITAALESPGGLPHNDDGLTGAEVAYRLTVAAEKGGGDSGDAGRTAPFPSQAL